MVSIIAAAGAASALAVVAPSPVAASPRVDWTPCPDDAAVDCGTLAVPLDYAHPHGPTITLAMERRPADDPAHKLGSIFVKPGGPGISGLHEAPNAAQRFGADVLAHFDVIGFDPRGVGPARRRGIRRPGCRRTRAAARRSCGPRPGRGSGRAAANWKSCRAS